MRPYPMMQATGNRRLVLAGDARGRAAQRAFEAVQHDFALSTRTVFYVMAGVMVLAYVVAHVALPRGRVEAEAQPAPAAARAR